MTAILLLGFLPAVCSADGFDDLRLRWRQMLIGANPDTSLAAVKSRLSSIQSAGNRQWTAMQKPPTAQSLWPDLASTSDSAQVSTGYSRLHDMAMAWATPGQSLYQNAGLLSDIIAGLDWMDAHRYSARSNEYGNWWDWEIGAPVLFVDVAVLLYDQLSANQLSRYMAAVERFDSNPVVLEVDTTKAVSTAANLTDKCKVALLRGILLKDQAKVALAVKDLSPVLAWVISGDGYYVDGSFIQHNRHPYTGSYGLVSLSDMADLLYLVNGSAWDVTDPNRANLAAWITNTYSPLIREGAMMDMVRGRAISRSSSPDHTIGHSTIGALLRITEWASDDVAGPLRSAIKRWLTDDTSVNYSANLPFDLVTEANRILNDDTIAPADLPSDGRVYASMDRVVHLRPAWAAGIAMHSTRIYNYESINSENLKGWHTSDGMTYLYNSDLTQFSGSFWPTVDAERLPGTTVVAGSTARQSQLGGSNAVGGVSLDGYTAVMMQLSPDGRQLSAKKSWFLLDDEMVALGADINSTAPKGTVETIVENRRLGADAVFTQDPNGAWANLFNNGAAVGYFFPDGAPWRSLNGPGVGAWLDINAGGSSMKLTAQYETLWFDHGAMASGAGYSYIVLPGKSADDTAAYAAAPGVQIVQNDAHAQAIAHAGLGIQAVNFWSASTTPVAGVSSDAVAAVMVHTDSTNGLLNIAVADPTQANNGLIHIQIAAAASSVVTADDGVSVDQLSPSVQLSVNVKGAHGRGFRVSLAE